ALGGLSRRFQPKGEKAGILLMDDYGHHPTEIMATLKTVKECWPERRLIVVFQPHRYTRTQALLDRFAISFNDADILVVTSIFPAGEPPIEGVHAEGLVQAIKDHGHKDVIFCPGQEDIVPTLLGLVRSEDLVMTLGAGNIYRQGDRFFENLNP
ncbi:MAG: UDP-N-acetylmuramate--L-alanine ligase, partial [Deltaproteobacteria bacterium]|nr:UDP-N-acetylmuramate--L-alanine ligase [Deltaproteobacteria bacterium]